MDNDPQSYIFSLGETVQNQFLIEWVCLTGQILGTLISSVYIIRNLGSYPIRQNTNSLTLLVMWTFLASNILMFATRYSLGDDFIREVPSPSPSTTDQFSIYFQDGKESQTPSLLIGQYQTKGEHINGKPKYQNWNFGQDKETDQFQRLLKVKTQQNKEEQNGIKFRPQSVNCFWDREYIQYLSYLHLFLSEMVLPSICIKMFRVSVAHYPSLYRRNWIMNWMSNKLYIVLSVVSWSLLWVCIDLICNMLLQKQEDDYQKHTFGGVQLYQFFCHKYTASLPPYFWLPQSIKVGLSIAVYLLQYWYSYRLDSNFNFKQQYNFQVAIFFLPVLMRNVMNLYRVNNMLPWYYLSLLLNFLNTLAIGWFHRQTKQVDLDDPMLNFEGHLTESHCEEVMHIYERQSFKQYMEMVGRKYVYQFIMWLYAHNNTVNFNIYKMQSAFEYGLDQKLMRIFKLNTQFYEQLKNKFIPRLRRNILNPGVSRFAGQIQQVRAVLQQKMLRSENLYNELMQKQFYFNRSSSDYLDDRNSYDQFDDIQEELSKEQSQVVCFLQELHKEISRNQLNYQKQSENYQEYLALLKEREYLLPQLLKLNIGL